MTAIDRKTTDQLCVRYKMCPAKYTPRKPENKPIDIINLLIDNAIVFFLSFSVSINFIQIFKFFNRINMFHVNYIHTRYRANSIHQTKYAAGMLWCEIRRVYCNRIIVKTWSTGNQSKTQYCFLKSIHRRCRSWLIYIFVPLIYLTIIN